MLFVTLAKFRGELDEEFQKKTQSFMKNPPMGIKIHNVFYTLGQYDILILYEASNEKVAMAAGLFFAGKAATETLVAIPLKEALAFLQQRP